jgi:uncharacterized protein (DUF1501 family)
MPNHFSLTRRNLLRLSGAVSANALRGAATGSLIWAASDAMATDYKALVCVSLYGGNDGLNMVVPTDTVRYGQYSAVRQTLALPQTDLLPLDGEPYGLHPALRALHPLWAQGRLATIFNVGPLSTPLSKAQYRAAPPNSGLVPCGLYSHSDQQTLWENGTSDPLVRTGWGGRAVDALSMATPVVASGASGRFGLSSRSGPLVVANPGTVFGAIELANEPWRTQYRQPLARANALRSLYAQPQDSVLGQAYADIGKASFEVSERLAAIVAVQPGEAGANPAISAAFSSLLVGGKISTAIGRQLYQIAKLVASNSTVGGNRQIYAASQRDYDTHGSQAEGGPSTGIHANLLKDLGDATTAFDQAMRNLGLGDSVTLFTQSDFGRTFKPNKSGGTDHAWGNHHLVLGGAVRGGRSYGAYPELVLGGADDVGVENWELQGRWIPTTSVAQYAATLLKWFGASPSELDSILPNLRNFSALPLPNFV